LNDFPQFKYTPLEESIQQICDEFTAGISNGTVKS
jgi:hypothetical protein